MEKEQSNGKLPPDFRCRQDVRFKKHFDWNSLKSLEIDVTWTISKLRRRKSDGIMLYGIRFKNYIDPYGKMTKYLLEKLKKYTFMVEEGNIEPIFDIDTVFKNLETLEINLNKLEKEI